MCVPLLTSACPDPHARSLSLLSCLLGFAGVSLPSRALSPPCRTRQRKAASAQSSRSGGEGGSVLVGMESTASTGESGPPPLPDWGCRGRHPCHRGCRAAASCSPQARLPHQRLIAWTASTRWILCLSICCSAPQNTCGKVAWGFKLVPSSAGVQALCVESPGAERSWLRDRASGGVALLLAALTLSLSQKGFLPEASS